MARIRVLICIDSIGQQAGTERYVADMVRRLDKTRFELHLCTLRESAELRNLAPDAAVAVFPLERFYDLRGLRGIYGLHRYINRHAIEIVHTFMPKGTIVGVLAARRSCTKAVVASRRSMGYFHTPLTLPLFRYLNRHTTRILANSERVKLYLVESEHLAEGKIDVLYNGVDMQRYAPGHADSVAAAALGIPETAKVIGIVANFRPVKDLPLFLRAMSLVAQRVPDAAFLLVGEGPLRGELGNLAAALGIAGRVYFSDGKGDVPEYLSRMSIACLTSQSEGFSNAVLEYLAAGLPVVATDVGGNAEAIEDGVNGLLVAGRDPQAFAAAVIRLLEDEGLRESMSRSALARCRERFDVSAAIRRQEQYYAALVGRAAWQVG